MNDWDFLWTSYCYYWYFFLYYIPLYAPWVIFRGEGGVGGGVWIAKTSGLKVSKYRKQILKFLFEPKTKYFCPECVWSQGRNTKRIPSLKSDRINWIWKICHVENPPVDRRKFDFKLHSVLLKRFRLSELQVSSFNLKIISIKIIRLN